MQTIREGNLYFLESPFHFKPPTDESTELEKRLSYLLGTVSARPAVVIRAPSWWDKFNTVTVIPALSKGKPSIVYNLKDRYGHQTQASYPFVPHNPHTIPVSRLGKYIGSLDRDELDELIYAFKWIHDPEMQRNPACEVPLIYQDLVKQDTPMSWKRNRDARSNVDLLIDKNSLKIRSNNFPSLNNFPLGDALKGNVPDAVVEDPDFVATTSPLPDEIIESHDLSQDEVFGFIRDNVESEKELPFTFGSNHDDQVDEGVAETVHKAMESEGPCPYGLISEETTTVSEPEPETPSMVPVEKDFPPSTFPKELLNEVAGRFDFSSAYYNGDLPARDPRYLTEEEIRNIRGNTTNAELESLFDYYRTLTPMDAFVLGPRLPTEALQRITGFSRPKTATLKRLCNVMRDIPDDEYQQRIEAEELAVAQLAADEVAKKAEKRAADKEAKAKLKEEQAKQLSLVMPYLNQSDMLDMKKLEEVQAFLALPMGVVKRAWQGTNFKSDYTEAKRFYKKGMKIYEEILAKLGNPDEVDTSAPDFNEIITKLLKEMYYVY